jgi:hypothetical protein
MIFLPIKFGFESLSLKFVYQQFISNQIFIIYRQSDNVTFQTLQ